MRSMGAQYREAPKHLCETIYNKPDSVGLKYLKSRFIIRDVFKLSNYFFQQFSINNPHDQNGLLTPKHGLNLSSFLMQSNVNA